MTVPSVAGAIDTMPAGTWKDTLSALWRSARISLWGFFLGALFTAYTVAGCRTVSDFRNWTTDGGLLGFIIATAVAPAWKASVAFKNSQDNKP